MKKILFLTSVSFSLFLYSCGEASSDEVTKNDDINAAKLEQQKQDSLRLVQAYEDSITAVLNSIRVQIFVRSGVQYDMDGFALDEGRLKEIKDFQSSKEHQITGYDDLEKIVVSGKSDKITIICSEGDDELYNSNEITLDGAKSFKGSGPNGGNGLKWVYAMNRQKDFNIKILYDKDRIVFEGKIHPARR